MLFEFSQVDLDYLGDQIPLAPTTVLKITKATCSLHNFIRKSGLNLDFKSVISLHYFGFTN